MIIKGDTNQDMKKIEELLEQLSSCNFAEINQLQEMFKEKYAEFSEWINNTASSGKTTSEDSEVEEVATQNKTLLLTGLDASPVNKRKFILGLVSLLSSIDKSKLGDRFAKLPKISVTSLTLDLNQISPSEEKPIEMIVNCTDTDRKNFLETIEGIEGIKYIIK